MVKQQVEFSHSLIFSKKDANKKEAKFEQVCKDFPIMVRPSLIPTEKWEQKNINLQGIKDHPKGKIAVVQDHKQKGLGC